jgi:UDP-2,3-diacylglucosamine pyrophosphatase LpxH
MRTLIVSDLHLGTRKRTDVLRDAELRARLWETLDGVDRVVLLGDVLELRAGVLHDSLAASRDFFEELGDALGGGEVVFVPGNHDYALIAPWLDRRGADAATTALEPEQLIAPDDAAPAFETIAAWLGRARLTLAYPGLWLRDDVYATHGHYLDCHLTVPTFERLAIGVMGRVVAAPAADARGVDDYEALVAPMYAWINAVSQRAPRGRALDGGGTIRAWRAIAGRGARSNRARLLVAAFPLGIRALNRAGIGPLRSDLSGAELRRAGLRAMGDVLTRTYVDAKHVVFGHTHRAGPLPDDGRYEWRAPGGARLWNSGCWVFETTFMRRPVGDSPYWPGVCVRVDDDGPPELLRLLSDRRQAELAAAVSR